jgi:hypothetical protein
MKQIFPILLLAFIFSLSSAQDNFKVIKVNGTILLREKNISLETGTVFSEKEDLLFRSENATAAVINSQKGRLILTSSNHDLSSARSNYLPSMYNISTRGGSLTDFNDLVNHFSGKYVVLDRQSLMVSNKNFPMDNDNFFYLRYRNNGGNINKTLAFSGDSLIVNKNSLLSADASLMPGTDSILITLFYRKGAESVKINEFELIFPDMKQLTSETEIILGEISDKPLKDKIEEVNSYINEFYGKVDREELVTWLMRDLGVK